MQDLTKVLLCSSILLEIRLRHYEVSDVSEKVTEFFFFLEGFW